MPASSRFRRAASALALFALLGGQAAAQTDPANPTCPRDPDWAQTIRQMRFTLEPIDGRSILLAEGTIDSDAVRRFQTALAEHREIDEIWLRSPGGDARVGNQLGRIVRETGIPTRIPSGWACFSACNFMFMGGIIRHVDEGGLFVVHMFTHTGDRAAIRSGLSRGEDQAIGLIGEIEQQSALLASEDNDFLIRMGISRRLLTEVMYRTSAVAERAADRATRRCLTQEEVNRYNVATVPWQG
jgi:hypothetical protein